MSTRQRAPRHQSPRDGRWSLPLGGLVIVILAVLLVACGGEAAKAPSTSGGSDGVAPAPALAPAIGVSAPGATSAAARASGGAPVSAVGNTGALPTANPQATGTKIIRNDAISLQVKDVSSTITAAGKVAADLGGYVVSSSTRGSSIDVSGDMTLRIPAENYDTATMRLRALGITVVKEESTSQDVGEEYVDLVARQKNLELTVAQLQTLLGTARTVDDTLKVQVQLNSTQSDLERIRGRIQYLDNRAALSTITLSLALTPAAKPGPTTDFGRAVDNAWATSLRGLQNLALLLIAVFIGGWWVILLLIGFGFLARWWLRRAPLRHRVSQAFATQPAFYPQAAGGIMTQPGIVSSPPPATLPAPVVPPNDPDSGFPRN